MGQLFGVSVCLLGMVFVMSEGFLFGFGGGGGGGGRCCTCTVRYQPVCCPAPPSPCGCSSGYGRKKRQITDLLLAANEKGEDPRCNSEELRQIILQNMSEDVEETKMGIHEMTEEKMEGKYAVICSTHPFSYISYGKTYCIDGNNNVNCYVFEM